eukprot:1159652-Pelagomonas_calceolata.AAC.13
MHCASRLTVMPSASPLTVMPCANCLTDMPCASQKDKAQSSWLRSDCRALKIYLCNDSSVPHNAYLPILCAFFVERKKRCSFSVSICNNLLSFLPPVYNNCTRWATHAGLVSSWLWEQRSCSPSTSITLTSLTLYLLCTTRAGQHMPSHRRALRAHRQCDPRGLGLTPEPRVHTELGQSH